MSESVSGLPVRARQSRPAASAAGLAKANLQPGMYTIRSLDTHWLVVDRERRHFLVPLPGPDHASGHRTPWDQRIRLIQIPDGFDPVPMDDWERCAHITCGVPPELL